MGHVLHPLLARGSLWHICLRFDWWCGLYPQDVINNKQREMNKFGFIVIGLVVLYAWVYIVA